MTVGLDSARPLAYAYAVPSPILQASSDTVTSHHFDAANTDSFRSASPILVHPPVFQDPVPAFDRPPVYQNDSPRAAHRPVYQDLDVTADPLPVNRASLLAVFSAQVPCMDMLLQFASVIREQQERHGVLNERSVAQDDKQHQLRIYTVELDNELNDRLKHVDLHLDLTHDWYHRQLRWFCCHSGSRTIAEQVIEACNRAARSTMQAERQLGEVESLIDKIRATRLSFVLSEPQYFIDPLGDSIKMIPGYDVCRQFGNRHCPYAYPSEYQDHYNWDQESCISEDAANLERHHIITLDRTTGSDHLDAVVHLGPVKEFQPTNHAAATMIKYMQELREVRDAGNYSLQRRSSSSSSSSYSFWASSRTLVPAPFPPLPASVELRPLMSRMTHIQARRRAARMTPKVSRRLLGG